MVEKVTLALIAGVAVTAVGAASSLIDVYSFYKGGGGGGQAFPVTVEVVDGSSNQPVPGAVAMIGTYPAVADINGVARFSAVLAGSQSLTIDASGYQPFQESIVVSSSRTDFTASIAPQGAGCAQQSCACDQVWDQALCRCSALIPAFIAVPATVTQRLQWLVNVREIPFGQCATVYPDNPGTCGSTYPGYPTWGCGSNTDTYEVDFSGSVQDSRGNPICNQTVAIEVSPGTIHWETPDQCSLVGLVGTGPAASGDFIITAPATVATDAKGNFTATISVRIANVQINQGCFGSFPGGTSSFNEILSLVFNVPTTQIRNYSTLTFQMQVCSYYGLFGV